MSGFTDDIRRFLASQRIAESEVYDASMLSSRQYKRAMQRAGKLFAIVKDPCYRGHYLRSQAGHCIQCDTSRIAYVKRHRKEAYVYIAGSQRERVFKIGFSETPWDRGPHLNHIGYGGITDWEVVYYAAFPEAGKAEFSVHDTLSGYVSPRSWIREGVRQTSREIFACAYVTVLRALREASDAPATREWEYHLARYRYGFVSYLMDDERAPRDTGQLS